MRLRDALKKAQELDAKPVNKPVDEIFYGKSGHCIAGLKDSMKGTTFTTDDVEPIEPLEEIDGSNSELYLEERLKNEGIPESPFPPF